MFTGIVQTTGRVAQVRPAAGGVRLVVDPGSWTHRPAPGDSICLSGCCLTLAEPPAGALLAFDVIPETLSRTTLGGWSPGTRVNLEPSLRAGDPIGGHTVQGHVDGTGLVAAVLHAPDYRITIRPPADLLQFIVPKGSICVDGVSLTVARVDPAAGFFEVALIPTTLAVTTLSGLKEGDRVNLEADVLAKTIVHYLTHFATTPSLITNH